MITQLAPTKQAVTLSQSRNEISSQGVSRYRFLIGEPPGRRYLVIVHKQLGGSSELCIGECLYGTGESWH